MRAITCPSTWTDARLRTVETALDHWYGPHRWRLHRAPLDELVMTVLSQHTSDRNTESAFASLRARFSSWDDIRLAPTEEVATAIRSGGLAAIKAPRIQAILERIIIERGTLDLDHVGVLPLDAAKRWLVSLPGVGPKTAACVLLFSFGRPVLPVDTHVHRVSRRLGLIDSGVSAERAQELLEARLGGDRDRVYAFHLNQIAHGRAICRARVPRCEGCCLAGCCDYRLEQCADV